MKHFEDIHIFHTLNRLILFLCFSLSLLPTLPSLAQAVEAAESQTNGNCQQTVKLLKKQKKTLSHEFRQIKRELGVVKESLNKPGFTEILGGIGYILGLFGLSYYWYARNLLKERK